ncbi:MAG: hypothetical protein JO159_17120 [Acidobacteria bacterium]|nr:hypothetical protein [Acidobacteriota bacterium]
MARGRSRYRGKVVATENGGWEIHYNVYLTDASTGKPKRHHGSRVVGHAPKMRKAEAEFILAAELAAINGGPITRGADGTIAFGEWMRNFYIPMRGANWRDATRRSNEDYLESHIYPLLEYVALKDITKFQVQMLLNRLATEGYSYTVVYHVRDLIKAALARPSTRTSSKRTRRARRRSGRSKRVTNRSCRSKCMPGCSRAWTARATGPFLRLAASAPYAPANYSA